MVVPVPRTSNLWTATLYAKTSGIVPPCWTAQLPIWCATGLEAQIHGLTALEANNSYLIIDPGLADVNQYPALF